MQPATKIAITLFTLLFIRPIATQGQAIRHKVILEIATGTWCPACPGSAMGADDLVASGANVAVVEHHDRDVYETPTSHQRLQHLGVAAYPTGFFDARTIFIGGDPDVSMFQQYQKHYDEAMAIPTPFDLRASWTQHGDSIQVTIDVDQVDFFGGQWLRLQAALTESHIQQNWQGLTQCNFVNRAMYRDQHGIPITTTQGGPTVSKTFSMAIDPNWVQQEMQLVVWLEDSLIRRIYNGTSFSLSTPAHSVDAAVSSIHNPNAPHPCNTGFTPTLVIRNMGANDLTAATITYQINDAPPATINWTGSVPYFGYAKVQLPTLPDVSLPTNVLTASIQVPGDSNPGNDVLTKTWKGSSLYQAGTYYVQIQPGYWASKNSWDVKNNAGTVMASGGPYTNGTNDEITVPVQVPINDCYTFSIYNSDGDGIADGSSFQLFSPLGESIYEGRKFDSLDFIQWRTPWIQSGIRISPNPSSGVFHLDLAEAHPEGADITIWSADGREAFRTSTTGQHLDLDLQKCPPGIYFMGVSLKDGEVVKKLLIR